MSQCLILTRLFLMWHVSQPPCLHSLSFIPLVSEVIYKYHKQHEAEHLQKREVIISLFTHRPVMMGAVVGFTLLSGTCDPLGKESYWPLLWLQCHVWMVLLRREVLFNYLLIATAHLTTNCALLIVLIYIGMPLIFLCGMIKINDFIWGRAVWVTKVDITRFDVL